MGFFHLDATRKSEKHELIRVVSRTISCRISEFPLHFFFLTVMRGRFWWQWRLCAHPPDCRSLVYVEKLVCSIEVYCIFTYIQTLSRCREIFSKRPALIEKSITDPPCSPRYSIIGLVLVHPVQSQIKLLQCGAPASRFALTHQRVIGVKAKNRRVTRCWDFFIKTRCRVTR